MKWSHYILVLTALLVVESSLGQSNLVFNSLDSLLQYAASKSLSIKNGDMEWEKAAKGKLAAALSIPDISGNLLSAQFTHNTKLPVSVFPGEVFGGDPGTFVEVPTGVKYSSALNSNLDIKLLNLTGWENLKLAQINTDLAQSSRSLTVETLEKNLADNYYNIVNVQEQIDNSHKNIAIADTLLQITQRRYNEGITRQQDLDDARANYLTSLENENQLRFLLEQYYLSLKKLCDIPADNELVITHQYDDAIYKMEEPRVGTLAVAHAQLQEHLAGANYKNAGLAFVPSLSFQLSNTFNQFNNDLKKFGGDWINSNYIGLKLNVPIPSSNTIANRLSAKYDLQLAKNNTEQIKLQATAERSILKNNYDKAFSQWNANKQIASLRQTSYRKHQQLYEEGLVALDATIASYTNMVNAEYSLISSATSVALTKAKIIINNKVRN